MLPVPYQILVKKERKGNESESNVWRRAPHVAQLMDHLQALHGSGDPQAPVPPSFERLRAAVHRAWHGRRAARAARAGLALGPRSVAPALPPPPATSAHVPFGSSSAAPLQQRPLGAGLPGTAAAAALAGAVGRWLEGGGERAWCVSESGGARADGDGGARAGEGGGEGGGAEEGGREREVDHGGRAQEEDGVARQRRRVHWDPQLEHELGLGPDLGPAPMDEDGGDRRAGGRERGAAATVEGAGALRRAAAAEAGVRMALALAEVLVAQPSGAFGAPHGLGLGSGLGDQRGAGGRGRGGTGDEGGAEEKAKEKEGGQEGQGDGGGGGTAGPAGGKHKKKEKKKKKKRSVNDAADLTRRERKALTSSWRKVRHALPSLWASRDWQNPNLGRAKP